MTCTLQVPVLATKTAKVLQILAWVSTKHKYSPLLANLQVGPLRQYLVPGTFHLLSQIQIALADTNAQRTKSVPHRIAVHRTGDC
jgi:hypothetical protein